MTEPLLTVENAGKLEIMVIMLRNSPPSLMTPFPSSKAGYESVALYRYG